MATFVSDSSSVPPFRISISGHAGHLSLHPCPPPRLFPDDPLPEFILPPAYPEETRETLRTHLEERYLQPCLDDDVFSPEFSGRMWEFDWFEKANIPLEPSAPRIIVAPSWMPPFRRRHSDGTLSGSKWDPASVEIDVEELLEGTRDTGSLSRMPGPSKDFVRGNLNNRPFRPGGLDELEALGRNTPEGARDGRWLQELIFGGAAQIVPPGFRRGMELGGFKEYPYCWKCFGKNTTTDVSSGSLSAKMKKSSVQLDDMLKKAWEDETSPTASVENISEQAEISGTPLDEVKLHAESTSVVWKSGVPLDQSSLIEAKLIETEDKSHAQSDGSFISGAQSLLDQVLDNANNTTSNKRDDSSDEKEQKQGEAWALGGGSEDIASKFYKLVPDMAIEFPFELDKFQKEAIYYLERGDSVFVAAHTSAGKTVVAEYAFALAIKHCTRAVYTAPIKTISNQKYRDFSAKFDVGLLTGDVSIRPEATCLIMTTEILRSMLYRGADIIRDIEWVIFDEVHYVNDAERGVVWEEVIIMLPKHINIVLLSATVPNTVEFADWIGRTKQKKIRVTGTTKRPVPLEHCLFFSGEMYKVCENEMFLPQGFKAAKDAYKKKNYNTGVAKSTLANASSSRNANQGRQADNHSRGRGQISAKHNTFDSTSGLWQNNAGMKRSEFSSWLLLVNKLLKKSLVPVVIFCFSRSRCDKSADSMYSMDLTNHSEKSEIRLFCDKAFSRLKGSDRHLPQIVKIEGLLKRGIGVHHAGLLPIVKEVVEMLFCRGIIKVLFSTETFAMGVNAPARTVVFDTLRKFDGKDHRKLLPGEYIQMAGRAGRRGLDQIGTVIIMCRDDFPEESELKNVIVGKPTRLESQFRLTYMMILHLLRVEELKVEDMLKRSFAEFHAQKSLPEMERLLLQKLHQPMKKIECIKGEPSIEEYYDKLTEAEAHRESFAEAVILSKSAQQFLLPGRVVVVKSQEYEDNLLGVILKSPSATYKQILVLVIVGESISAAPFSSSPPFQVKEKEHGEFEAGGYFIMKNKRAGDDEYFSSVGSRKGSATVNIKLPYKGDAAGMRYEVMTVENKEIISICVCKIKIDQFRLLEEPSNSAYSHTIQKILETRQDGNRFPPALDAIKDLKLKDLHHVEKYHAYNKMLQELTENKCHGCIKFQEHFAMIKEQKRHKEEVNKLKFQMSDDALQQMPEFQGRIDVLKETHCIDTDLVVQLKGRVACEMNSGEELICTECLFENQFNDLEPEEAVAIMSAFVFQQRNMEEPSLTPKLEFARQRLYNTALQLGQLQVQFGVPVDPEDYARENLKFGLVQVVYEWAKGTPFADICELTDVSEGLIVRTIVRLDETCREFRNAASIMGNSALVKKMEAASNAIKRDIVFAASLYVTGV